MVHLIECCVNHPGFHFEVIYGISANLRNRWDNSNVAHMGYQPQDNAEDYLEQVLALNTTEDPVSAQFHGAMFCGLEFTGDVGQIE
jgi:uronate dehydrogenase